MVAHLRRAHDTAGWNWLNEWFEVMRLVGEGGCMLIPDHPQDPGSAPGQAAAQGKGLMAPAEAHKAAHNLALRSPKQEI